MPRESIVEWLYLLKLDWKPKEMNWDIMDLDFGVYKIVKWPTELADANTYPGLCFLAVL